MDSVDNVTAYINSQTDLEVKKWEVQRVMKNQLNMRFKVVRRGPIYLKSDRNRICRQQAAMKIVALLQEGKILLNIDETWLNQSDFR